MMLDITAAFRAQGEALPFVHMEQLPDADILGEVVTFPEPAVIKGTFSLMDDTLDIKGKLTVKAQAVCARCLSPVSHTVSVKFHESFLRLDQRDTVEEDPWEEKLVFSGHRVDLSDLAASLAVLELPMRFLCKQSCEGIQTSQTGEDPATQEDTPDDTHPFGALRQLYTKLQEE